MMFILTIFKLALISLAFGAPILDQQIDATGIATLAKKDTPTPENVLRTAAGTYHGKCDSGIWHDGACYCSSGCIEKSGICHELFGACSGASKLGYSVMNGVAIAASLVIGTTVDMPISFALVTIAALIPNTLAAPYLNMRTNTAVLPTADNLPDIEERSGVSERSSQGSSFIPIHLAPIFDRSEGKCVHGSWYDGYCHCSSSQGCSNIHGVCTNPFGTCSPPRPSSDAKKNLASASMGALAFAGAAAVAVL